MTSRLAAALLLAATSAPALAAAPTTVALLPTTGANIPLPQLTAAGDMLRAYLEATGAFAVVRLPGPVGGSEPSGADAASAARDSGADLGVVLRVTRLATTGQAYVAAYRTDGLLVHADQLSFLGVDDLEPALQRLAEGLARGRLARDLATIETVTAREQLPLRKIPASSAFGLSFVALMPANRPVPDARAGGAGGLGFTWLYDARTFLADVTVAGAVSAISVDEDKQEFRKPKDAAFLVSMGAYYPFSKENASPYLGVGAGYGWTRFGGEGGHGIQGRVAGGLLLGRLSNVSVKLEVGWFWNAYAERDAATGREVNVNGATASLTLLTGPR
jgi:hypothetical protein